MRPCAGRAERPSFPDSVSDLFHEASPEPAEPITDESRRYTVFVPLTKLGTLKALLRKAANSFDQQEILLSVRGRRERIIPRPQDGFLG